MSFRYRKSITVFPGFRLNLGKKGVSATVGMKGLSVNVGKRGTYVNTGIPGTGLSQRTKLSEGHTELHISAPEHESLPRPRRRMHFGLFFWLCTGTLLAGATGSQAVVIGFWVAWVIVALVMRVERVREEQG